MLNVEDRFMIKDLHRKGVSISEIARQVGCDRKTVRRVLEEPLLATPAPRQPKSRKLDPFVSYLEGRIQEGVLNAEKLYRELCAQGYTGKERQVRAFVQPYRPARQAAATVRFETEPGQQAQVDWGHFGTIQHQGRQRRLYGFVMTLGWSRACYLEFTVSMETIWFLRCHQHAFTALGGVPREVLHDNLKTAVLERDTDGTIHWHPRYLDFASYYGFTPRACRPYRAQTKGKVENGIKYVRGNFWVGLHYRDLADLNQQARRWCDQVANQRRHGTTREIPADRLPLEGLSSIATKPAYDTSLMTQRLSSRDCLVSYGGNFYSVPAPYASQRLVVRETEAGQLVICTVAGEEIARHALSDGQGQRVVQASHYTGITKGGPARRAEAVQQRPAQPDLAVLVNAPQVEQRPLSVYDQLLMGGP